ncbi:MAG: hypothetical protein ACRD4B_04515 [Acidobacteriota bacterium]
MDSRHQQLLCGLVSEYITTGQPVGSGFLQEKLKLSVSPATVRMKLRDLEEEGWIKQPHTSAGRIPTDKGYREYVNSLNLQRAHILQMRRLARLLQEYQRGDNNMPYGIAKVLSRYAHALVVSSASSGGVYGTGLAELLGTLTEDEQETMHEASRILDDISEYAWHLAPRQPQEIEIFIGAENPALAARHTSIIARRARTSHGNHVTLFIIGPKRMPYAKHAMLLNNVATLIEQEEITL